jgi:hypothetical protein
MAGTIPAFRELARPVVRSLAEAFFLDEVEVHVEPPNSARDVAVWYEVSILSHPEMLALVRIAEATGAKLAVIPKDLSRVRVELRVSGA